MTNALSLRYAVRSLRREPALVIGAILTIAISIAVNAAMIGLVTRLMFSDPEGVTGADRVARVALQMEDRDGERFVMSTTSYPVFRALGTTGAFASAAAVRDMKIVWGRGGDAREIAAIAASGDYFTTLGARAAAGRFFGAQEDQLPTGTAVAVLSHTFWKNRYASDPRTIGAVITLAGEPYVVIGVAPQGFTGDALAPVDVFIPLSAAMRGSTNWSTEPALNLVSVVGRLADGVSLQQVSELATSRLRAADVRKGIAGVALRPLVSDDIRASTRGRIALWLAAVSVIVLIIASANVATLLVLRSVRKRRDVAIRLALGASRRDLAAQSVVEGLLLAGAGGAAGLMLSTWLADIVRVTLLPDLAPSARVLDPRVLTVSIVLALLAGTAAALAPVMLLRRQSVARELHGGAGTLGSARQSAAQHVLIGVQVALCSVLLVGAGLFVRSLQRVQSQELGFSPDHLLFVELDFRDRLPAAERDAVYADLARAVTSLRGVTGATIAQAMPFGSFHVPPISVPGRSTPPAAGEQLPFMYASTPEYLELMRVGLLEGRLLDARDRRGSALVVLVNQTMAREVWPGESAIGKCIRVGFDPAVEPSPLAPATLPCRQVVGVVRDSRARSVRRSGREASMMQYYVPFEQLPPFPFGEAASVNGLVVGVADPDRLASAVQRFIQSSSMADVYARVRPYQDLLDPQMRPWKLGASVFVGFGVLALCITAVGLFAVIAYLVSQRTREIGLRLALGGERSRIGGAVVLAALRMVGLGVAAGVGVSLLAGPALRDLLFETSPRDGAVLVTTVLTCLLVTTAAAAIPAWRAARVSPLVALRSD